MRALLSMATIEQAYAGTFAVFRMSRIVLSRSD